MHGSTWDTSIKNFFFTIFKKFFQNYKKKFLATKRKKKKKKKHTKIKNKNMVRASLFVTITFTRKYYFAYNHYHNQYQN